MNRQDFISRLAYTQDVNQHYSYVDTLAKGGKVKELRDLLDEIQANGQFGQQDWAPRSVCGRIYEALALTEGLRSAMAALDCFRYAKQRDDYSRFDMRQLADKIVSAQTPLIISQLLGEVNDGEMAALLMYSAVIRQKLPPDCSSAQNIARQLLATGHPLSILPMSLFECERKLCLPRYRIGSSGGSLPFGPFYRRDTVKTAVAENALRVTEIKDEARTERVSAAVANWEQQSNGQTEVRLFALKDAIPSLIGPYLPKLGLECLPDGDGFDCDDQQPLSKIFNLLFSAAANGGAYTSGQHAAYGRLAAWQSLAGLVGCPLEATISDIYRTANACQWAFFCASNNWYYQVAWDIGIACLNPSNKELVILAATDTD